MHLVYLLVLQSNAFGAMALRIIMSVVKRCISQRFFESQVFFPLFRGFSDLLRGYPALATSFVLMLVFCLSPVAATTATATVTATATATATECARPPAKINLLFDFEWPDASLLGLTKKLRLQCGEPENYQRLIHDIKFHLNNDGISLAAITLNADGQQPFPEIHMKANPGDGNATAGLTKSAILPVQFSPETTDIIPLFTPKITVKEDQEIVIGYVTDDMFIRSVGGVVKLQWLRDGAIVPNAHKTRYKLALADVGRQISAILRVTVDGRTIAYQKTRPSGRIEMAERPPEVKAVLIKGEAIVGNQVAAQYRFLDMNPDDNEGETRFTWLRGNTAIHGASKPVYTIVPADLGQVISVMVQPKSDDGIEGDAVVASMPSVVDDGLIKLTPETIEQITFPDDQNVESEETLEAIFESGLENMPVPEMPDDADPAGVAGPDGAFTGVQYVTPGLRLAPSSPTQFIGFKNSPSQLLSDDVFDQIASELIGRPIDIALLKDAVERVNQAYADAGFKLSRALLPEQIVEDGRIEVKLVEVKIGAINFENDQHLSKDYLARRLGLNSDDFIDLDAVELALRDYNSTNKSQLSTELAPGAVYGTTDLFINVDEPSRVELPTISIDNYNKGQTKIVPQTLSSTFNNIIGIDDETTVSLSDGIGTTAFTIGVSAPLGVNGANISLNYAGSETKSVTENADLVGYRGTSRSIGTGLSFPIGFSKDWANFASFAYGRGKNDMVAPTTGDLLVKSQTEKAVIGMSSSYSDGSTQFSIAPSWHVIHSKTEIPPTNKWVQKLDTEMSLSQYLSPKVTANLGGRFLYTRSRSFIDMPDEIISVGGPGSVRAYRPSESSGYRGYTLTGELRSDVASWDDVTLPTWLPSLQPYVFIDHVRAQQIYRKTNRSDYWSGFGVGLTIPSIYDIFSFDTYWAQPLDDDAHKDEKAAYKDDLLQFSIKARLNIN